MIFSPQFTFFAETVSTQCHGSHVAFDLNPKDEGGKDVGKGNGKETLRRERERRFKMTKSEVLTCKGLFGGSLRLT